MGRVARVLMAILMGLGCRSLSAQEIRATSEEVHSYASPMVLEISLDALREDPAAAWSTEKTRLFDCRGVTIESLTLRLISDEKATVTKLDYRFVVKNNSGKDKRVTVRTGLLKGETTLAGTTGKPIKLEQGGTQQAQGMLILESPETWNSSPRPRLQIALSLVDY